MRISNHPPFPSSQLPFVKSTRHPSSTVVWRIDSVVLTTVVPSLFGERSASCSLTWRSSSRSVIRSLTLAPASRPFLLQHERTTCCSRAYFCYRAQTRAARALRIEYRHPPDPDLLLSLTAVGARSSRSPSPRHPALARGARSPPSLLCPRSSSFAPRGARAARAPRKRAPPPPFARRVTLFPISLGAIASATSIAFSVLVLVAAYFPSTLLSFHSAISFLRCSFSARVERGSTISLCFFQLSFLLFELPHPTRRSAQCSPFNHSALPCLEQHEFLLKAQLVLRVRRENNLLLSPFTVSCFLT